MKHTSRLLCLFCFFAAVPPVEAKWVWDPDVGFTDTSAYENGDPKTLYEGAVALYDGQKFKPAADEFRKIAKYCPDPVYQEKSQYMAGEALYMAGEYYKAYTAYDSYLEYYPQTDRLKEIVKKQLDIGLKLVQGAKKDLLGVPILSGHSTGVELMRKVLAKYPYEEFADEYDFLLANHFFEREDYEEATIEFEQFVKTYPTSEWAPTAQFQLAQCHLRAHQGLEYDPRPMEKARAVLEKYIEKNPNGDKVKEAEATLAQLDNDVARKDFETALFYRKKGKPKSALVYLRGIVAQHPGSPWAIQAEGVIRELEPPPPEETPSEGTGGETPAAPAGAGETPAPPAGTDETPAPPAGAGETPAPPAGAGETPAPPAGEGEMPKSPDSEKKP